MNSSNRPEKLPRPPVVFRVLQRDSAEDEGRGRTNERTDEMEQKHVHFVLACSSVREIEMAHYSSTPFEICCRAVFVVAAFAVLISPIPQTFEVVINGVNSIVKFRYCYLTSDDRGKGKCWNNSGSDFQKHHSAIFFGPHCLIVPQNGS